MSDCLLEDTLNYLNQIKEFMYCPEYNHLDIYSRQYYKEIILNNFSNSGVPYTFIFGDFDKLGDINKKYGKEAGDKAIYNALKVIKYSLPKKAIISRIAGDEFSIILPNCSKEQASFYKNFITDNLSKYSSITNGLTITLGIEDSTKTPLAHMLATITEKEVNSLKSKRKNSNSLETVDSSDINLDNFSDDKWSSLNHCISSAVKNYISDLRFSDSFKYSSADFKKESLLIIDEIGNLLEHKKNISNENKLNLSSEIQESASTLLHSLLNYEDNMECKLNSLPQEELIQVNKLSENLSDHLIRNPISHLYTKTYLNTFLADEICASNSQFQAIYFSNVGVKTSNTAYGHDKTDIRLGESAHKLKNALYNITSFNNNNFAFDNLDNFLLDFGGGNYLALIESTNSISDKNIEELIADINSDEETLKFGYSITQNINNTNIELFKNSIQELKQKCDDNKDIIKHRTLDNTDSSLAFDKEIIDCVNYYLNTIPNAEDITSKKRFLSNIFIALINEASKYKGLTYDEVAR